MVILRLKQCERALADGRLDEAFELVRQSDVRAHRRGQELVSELVEAFVKRGRGHLAQGRLIPAAADASKAVQLGGNLSDAVELREAVGAAQHACENANLQAGRALALARRHADQGQLSVGQRVLDESPASDARLDDLKQELAARRAGLESNLKKATQAFDAGDWEAAIDHIATVGKNGAQDAALRRLADRIADHVVTEAAPHMEAGRLDQAAALLERLTALPVDTTAMRRLQATLDQCHRTSLAIAEGCQPQVEELLLQLQVMWPGAAWIGQLVERARQWGQIHSELRSSPLSLLALTPPPARTKAPPPLSMPMPAPKSQQMPSLVLHVDGVGSYQVLTSPTVTIGPRGSSRTLDLPLLIDASAPTITLSRSDEDYFLKTNRPVTVNESPCTSRLLCSGDRIGLGARCRLTFRRPSAASSTAVLDISGARLPVAGIRQVILLDREIVIGPGSCAHIRADQLPGAVVLIRGEAGFACRSGTDITIDGKNIGKTANLPTGEAISIGSLRFVISREQRP